MRFSSVQKITGSVLLSGLLGLMWWMLPTNSSQPLSAERLPVEALLTAAEPFADPPAEWDYQFPADHGAHPEQFGEYWLVAGRLHTPRQQTLGFQLAFYRLALTTDATHRTSHWAAQQVYRAQLVLDSAQDGWAEERYSREALGLSGAEPYSVWLEAWSLVFDPECDCWRLHVALDDQRLNLRLQAATAPPLPITGVPGLTVAQPGSHGYWWPDLQVQGQWQYGAEEHAVTGEAVLEHVWGRRLPVAQGQLTLNRLWLVLDEGTALRCLQLRRRGGGGRLLGECVLWSAQSDSPAWQPSSDRLRPLDSTQTPLTWLLERPAQALQVEFAAVRPQARNGLLPAWSGLLKGRGERDGQALSGWGWLEFTQP